MFETLAHDLAHTYPTQILLLPESRPLPGQVQALGGSGGQVAQKPEGVTGTGPEGIGGTQLMTHAVVSHRTPIEHKLRDEIIKDFKVVTTELNSKLRDL